MGKEDREFSIILLLVLIVAIFFDANGATLTGRGVDQGALQKVVVPSAGKGESTPQPTPPPTSIPTPSPTHVTTGSAQAYIEINIEIVDNQVNIISSQYTCAEQDNPSFETFKASLIEYGNPAPNLPATLHLGQPGNAPHTEIRWSQILKLYTDETQTQKNEFKGVAFIDSISCESLNNLQATLTSPTVATIQTVLITSTTSFSAGVDAGSCDFLHKSSRAKNNPYYVFITDKGFDDFIKGNTGGNSFWGNALDQEDVDNFFNHYLLDRFFAVPPFQDFSDVLNIMHYKSSRNYPSCNTLCDFQKIQADMINECNMQGVSNFKMIVLHGMTPSATGGPILGVAYLNSPYAQVMVGEWTMLFSPNSASQFEVEKGYELLGAVPAVVLHELGHTYNIDHTDCGYVSLNSPMGICFSPSNCAPSTGDECELYSSSKEVVVTRTDQTVARSHGFMNPYIGYIPIPAASYQLVGKKHIETIGGDVLKNRFGRSANPTCGNSIIEEGEDVDHNQGYLYDAKREVVGTCMHMSEGVAEMLYQYPMSRIVQGSREWYLSGVLTGGYTPFDAGPVTKDKQTCQLYHECGETDFLRNRAVNNLKGIIFGNNYDWLGYLPAAAQVDCTNVDYRFPPNTVTTNFNGRNPGEQTCDLSHPSFNKDAPFLPQEDDTLLYAYQKVERGTKTLKAGIVDPAGNVVQQTSWSFPSGVGNLVATKYAESSKAQDWTHNYDPYNQPTNSFASFTHPVTLVLAYEDELQLHRFYQDFLSGIDPSPLYTVSMPGSRKLAQLVSAGHKGNNFVITFLTTDDRAYQVKVPTVGTKLSSATPTLLSGSLAQHNVPFSRFSTSLDQKVLVSVRDSGIPSGGLRFTQHLAGQSAHVRELLPDKSLPRTVQADTAIATDYFGRYTFSTIEPETNAGTPITINHHTLTSSRKHLRQDFEIPVTGLNGPQSVYHGVPQTKVLVKETIDGAIIAVPIEFDQVIALIDEDEGLTLLPSHIPPLFNVHDPFVAVTAIEKMVYQTISSIERPVDTDITPALLTRVNVGAAMYPAARLYLGMDAGTYTTVDLDIAQDPQATLTHFALFATDAGTSIAPSSATSSYVCSQTSAGFLSYLSKKVWDKKGDTVAVGKYTVNYEPTTFSLYTLANTPYGAPGNNLVGSATIAGDVWPSDLVVNPITTTGSSSMSGVLRAATLQNHALALGTERDPNTGATTFHGYFLDFNSGRVDKYGPLPGTSGYLVDTKVCQRDFASNEVSCCQDVRNCPQLTPEVTIPGVGQTTLKYKGNDLLIYSHRDATQATYIYDFNTKQIYTFPQKAIFVTAKQNGEITVLFEQANKLVAETMRISGGALQQIKQLSITATLGRFQQVIGVEEIENNLAVIVADVGQTKTLEIWGDQFTINSAQCTAGNTFTGNAAIFLSEANNHIAVYDLTLGMSRVFEVSIQ